MPHVVDLNPDRRREAYLKAEASADKWCTKAQQNAARAEAAEARAEAAEAELDTARSDSDEKIARAVEEKVAEIVASLRECTHRSWHDAADLIERKFGSVVGDANEKERR